METASAPSARYTRIINTSSFVRSFVTLVLKISETKAELLQVEYFHYGGLTSKKLIVRFGVDNEHLSMSFIGTE